MPSLPHELLVELVRARGELVRELVQACSAIALPAEATPEAASIDLSQVAPTEYRADHITVFRDPRHRPLHGFVVEVQRQIDPGKHRSWPVYVTTARAALDCPVALLVIAPDRAVADWARTPIETGHPGFLLLPIVVSYDDVPVVHDTALARRVPELAVLSALAHPTHDAALIALDAIQTLHEDQARLYYDVVMDALPATIRRVLEDSVEGYQYKTEFARSCIAQGREEGREEGREAGLHDAVSALARVKLDGWSAEEESAIFSIHDAAVLTQLIVALGQATSPEQARAALDAALGR